MRAEGDTALWDAMALAKDQLIEYGKKYPEAKKRIICISDGEDTKSTTNTAPDICWRLREAGIVADTVSLGYEDNHELRTLSYLLVSLLGFGDDSFKSNTLTRCENVGFLPFPPNYFGQCACYLRAGAIPLTHRAANYSTTNEQPPRQIDIHGPLLACEAQCASHGCE